MSRVIQAYQLRPGDKFEEMPRAWYGPGVVRKVYTRYDKGVPYITPPSKNIPSWANPQKWNPTLCITFNNDNVVNPPGLLYERPEMKVRLLKRNGKPVRGRPHQLPQADVQVEVREPK